MKLVALIVSIFTVCVSIFSLGLAIWNHRCGVLERKEADEQRKRCEKKFNRNYELYKEALEIVAQENGYSPYVVDLSIICDTYDMGDERCAELKEKVLEKMQFLKETKREYQDVEIEIDYLIGI